MLNPSSLLTLATALFLALAAIASPVSSSSSIYAVDSSPARTYSTQTEILPHIGHTLIVYNPKILYPSSNTTVWTAGTQTHVRWETNSLPMERKDTLTGTLLLGYLKEGPEGYTEGEHLDVYHPLAKGFKLAAGRVDFVVPSVAYRRDYIVVLLGDSGNASNRFTIVRGPEPTTSTQGVSS